MYRALYRKWRPQTFADVVGQQAITTALSNQILANKVGHAFMFTGTRGTGKTTCAKILAKAVNCENPNGANPCGECAPCKGLEDGSILDVIEIDAASNNGVDDIRDLRDETAYRPSRCKYKVYIIDEVHMLSTAAFNALLKIMEEPPSHVIFILATTEIHKVPATILSRCQRYDFTRIPAGQIAAHLMAVAGDEGIELTEPAAELIARLGDGAMRDALSLLDTCSGVGGPVDEELVRRMAGVSDKGYLFDVSAAVQQGDASALLALVATLREKSIDVKRLTEELVHHYRNLMLAAAAPDGALLQSLPGDERKHYLEDAAGHSSADAIRAVRRLAEAMDKMGRSPDPRIELELALFDLCSPAPTPVATNPVQTQTPAPRAQAPAAFASSQSVAAPAATASKPVATVPQAETPPWEEEPPVPEAQAPQPPKAEQTPAPLAQPAPVSTPPPQSEPAAAQPPAHAPTPEGLTPFTEWETVMQHIANSGNKMLYSYMKKSTAFFEGPRVLIDGGDMFLTHMRNDETAAGQIKDAIQAVTGKRYAIGPYTGGNKAQKKQASAEDTLKDWQAKGVPVEYENDNEE